MFDASVIVADTGDGNGLIPWMLYAGGDNSSPTDNTDSSMGYAIALNISEAFMAQLQSYAFTTVENPLSNGGNFSRLAAGEDASVPSSGVCQPAATSAIVRWSGNVVQAGGTWPADQYSEVTVLTNSIFAGPDVFGPMVRCSSSADTGYQVNCVGMLGSAGNGSALVFSRVAGTSTQIGSSVMGLTWNVGDVVRLMVVGTTLTLTKNGITIFTNTSSTIASGSPGFILNNTTAPADTQISLWAAGGTQAATPTFNSPAGTYTGTQTVTISSSTSGGTIYYTTDGTTPTHSSSSIFSGGSLTITPPKTVTAFAALSDFGDSALSSAAYSEQSAPSLPGVTMAGGSGNVFLTIGLITGPRRER